MKCIVHLDTGNSVPITIFHFVAKPLLMLKRKRFWFYSVLSSNKNTIDAYFPLKLKKNQVEFLIMLARLPMDVKDYILTFLFGKCLKCSVEKHVYFLKDNVSLLTYYNPFAKFNPLCQKCYYGCRVASDHVQQLIWTSTTVQDNMNTRIKSWINKMNKSHHTYIKHFQVGETNRMISTTSIRSKIVNNMFILDRVDVGFYTTFTYTHA
jgi:hypothetical protein